MLAEPTPGPAAGVRRLSESSPKLEDSHAACSDHRAGTLCLDAKVERLRTRQMLVPDDGERAAAARVLHAHPGESRIEVVASVHEPRSCPHLVADGDGGLLV